MIRNPGQISRPALILVLLGKESNLLVRLGFCDPSADNDSVRPFDSDSFSHGDVRLSQAVPCRGQADSRGHLETVGVGAKPALRNQSNSGDTTRQCLELVHHVHELKFLPKYSAYGKKYVLLYCISKLLGVRIKNATS